MVFSERKIAKQIIDYSSRHDFSKTDSAKSLELREKEYFNFFNENFNLLKNEVIFQIHNSANSWQIMHDYSTWMDNFIIFTRDFVFDELPILIDQSIKERENELSYLKGTLFSKQKKVDSFKKLLEPVAEDMIPLDPAEKLYYEKKYSLLTAELSSVFERIAIIEKIIPKLNRSLVGKIDFKEKLVIFARGGYGREELTFSSDIDLGYAINSASSNFLEKQLIQELVKRMNQLFSSLPVEIATQYFEQGEDLSRFRKKEALHTIPAILESRTIWGNKNILCGLKDDILKIVPLGKTIELFSGAVNKLTPLKNNEMNIKEGYGGLRHFQNVYWLSLIVLELKDTNFSAWLDTIKNWGWISELDQKKLTIALEFFHDLRNFLGLLDSYSSELIKIGAESLINKKSNVKNYWDDNSCLAYLKLRNRFLTVDYLDRFRLQGIETIAELSNKILTTLLNRNYEREYSDFNLTVHLGKKEINKISLKTHKAVAVNEYSLFSYKVSNEDKVKDDYLRGEEIFLNLKLLFNLLIVISKTGYHLSEQIRDEFSLLIPRLYGMPDPGDQEEMRRFFIKIFTGKFSSVAINEMLIISDAVTYSGIIHTLLGRFIPEANQMRFILRNINVHEFPLCQHSLRSLKHIEQEIELMEKNELELWSYIDQNSLFALKWVSFFHDIGKIDPYKDHESYGSILSTQMLVNIGWQPDDELLNLVRYLTLNHQSVVRISRMATSTDQGIIKFLELAERTPRLVILLYLINLADLKSVNSELEKKLDRIESLFEQTINIIHQLKGDQDLDIDEAVKFYLQKEKSELFKMVMLEVLQQKSCNKNLDDALLTPLQAISPESHERLLKNRMNLESSIKYLTLGGLTAKMLGKYGLRFKQLVGSYLSPETLLELVSDEAPLINWLFAVFPNRYLLESGSSRLMFQLFYYKNYKEQNNMFSYIKGAKGEEDCLTFHCDNKEEIAQKISYALGSLGSSIVTGKVNSIDYQDGRKGLAGFFHISVPKEQGAFSTAKLEEMVTNLKVPDLKEKRTKSHYNNLSIQYFTERKRGYSISEKKGKFIRGELKLIAVKISLIDARFCFFKIIKTFNQLGVNPHQITVTTIGNQVVDYFYISFEEKKILDEKGFETCLKENLEAEIAWNN